MTLNSINTNVAALRAQENIGAANRASSSSIARLSSGERIVRAADDVASMSAGTSLKTNVTTLRTALINTSQGSSMLQVADGALSEITDILLRQKAIAVQAGSGSLSTAERSFLNQEFQNLVEEIDRLAGQTNFNGVNLLDGTLFDKTVVQDNATAEKATMTLSITDPAAGAGNLAFQDGNGNSVNVGGSITAGAPLTQQLQELAGDINNTAGLEYLSAEVNGSSLTVTYLGGGDAAAGVTATEAAPGDYQIGGRILLDNAGAIGANNAYGFNLPESSGINARSGVAVGTIGDSVINNQIQTNAFYSLTFAEADAAFAGEVLNVDDGFGGTVALTGPNAGAATFPENPDGTHDYEAAVDQFVDIFNDYASTTDDGTFVFNQVEARREGMTMIIESKLPGAVLNDAGAAIAAFAGAVTTNANVSVAGSTTLANNVNQGIGLEGVTNEDFVGQVSGFNVEFQGANLVDISLTVGEFTYEATGVTANADSGVRLVSNTGGGYVDFNYQGAPGTGNVSVLNQSDADILADRLDTAFSGMTFYQGRGITSYSPSGDITVNGATRGTLNGSSFELQLADFSDVSIQDITVSAPPAGGDNAVMTFTINNEEYRADLPLTDELGANGVYTFIGQENGNNVLTFRTGDNSANETYTGDAAIKIENEQDAAAVEAALKSAFGLGEGPGQEVTFQVGTSTSDSLGISIGTATTDVLYDGQSINVLTQADAATAGDVLDTAIETVTSVRAEVGALQSRFDFASANIESSLQNQDAARGVLLDTDISAESTKFATAQVQLQAGISVLAQANLLSQNLLKLIG